MPPDPLKQACITAGPLLLCFRGRALGLRLLAINLYGYAAGGETPQFFCLQKSVTLL